MRELKVVGLDADGKRIVCETADTAEKFAVRVDERLRAAVRGDRAVSNQTQIDVEVPSSLRPRDIQSRIRAGASVEQLAAAAGVSPERVMRFAHPVLLERSRAAELATASHPILANGPSVLTLLETVTGALISRGLDPESTKWDAWRNEDSRWTVQLGWKAGRSDNVAHFRFSPGAHGGTTTAFDDAATELIDPNYTRPALRSVAPVAQLHFEESVAEIPVPTFAPTPARIPAPERAPAPVVARTPAPQPIPVAPAAPVLPVAPAAPEPVAAPAPAPAAVAPAAPEPE
ncbi:MAG: septation protein SepH, partial [Mycobacterium sp.]|nr:septation protein SepH [Mycobacterium sp.]